MINMTKQQALELSIEHWRRLTEAADLDDVRREGITSSACALCDAYLLESPGPCGGCPVKEFTGLGMCKGTPWLSVAVALAAEDMEEFKERAKQELAFLEMLMRL